jgi:glycerol-3-phosphate dehydrogenase (NAD+)
MRDTAQARYFNETRRNPKYLSEFSLPANVVATTDLAAAMAGVQLIFHALPCQKTPEWLAEHRDSIPRDVLICSTVKGLYLPTKQLIGHAICAALERDQPLAYLSGPSFSIEIMKDYPTSVVVASRELFHATLVQRVLSNMSMRVYTSQDIVGVQLGGALKNPLAVGAGMIAGLGFGTNTLSAAVTRSTAELTALCVAMGGKPETISGLAGVGDLMLTAFSSQSRNQRCGQRLVKGEKIEAILNDMTVEGVATASVAVAFADMCGLELPLFRCVDDLIAARIEPKQAVERLMGRKLRQEGQDEMWRKSDSSAT